MYNIFGIYSNYKYVFRTSSLLLFILKNMSFFKVINLTQRERNTQVAFFFK